MDKRIEIKQQEKELIELTNKELERCEEGIYPRLCDRRRTQSGREMIYRMVLKVCSEQKTSVKTALALIESSLE